MMTTNATPKLFRALIAIPLILVLAACGGSDDPDPTPTAAVSGNVTATSTAAGITIEPGERPSGSISGLTQRLSLNGCRVTIPLDWVSEGDGTGSTRSGAHFTLYGGPIGSDQAWENAVLLVANQVTRRGVDSLTRGDDWVMAVLSGDRGFTFRARYEDRYCDFSVSGIRAIPESERNAWGGIIGSLTVAPPEEQTPASGG
jgi:hypothetical protein